MRRHHQAPCKAISDGTGPAECLSGGDVSSGDLPYLAIPSWVRRGLTKPYKFIGFGAMDVTKPYKFIGFEAMDVTKPYQCIGLVTVVHGSGGSFLTALGLPASRGGTTSRLPPAPPSEGPAGAGILSHLRRQGGQNRSNNAPPEPCTIVTKSAAGDHEGISHTCLGARSGPGL